MENMMNKNYERFLNMTDTDLLGCILGCDDNDGKLETIEAIRYIKGFQAREAVRIFFKLDREEVLCFH